MFLMLLPYYESDSFGLHACYAIKIINWKSTIVRRLRAVHWLVPSRLSWERREARGVMGRRKGEGRNPFPPSHHPSRFSPFSRETTGDESGPFILYRITFTPARKPYRIGLLFTHGREELFRRDSVTELGYATLISKVESYIYISDRYPYQIQHCFECIFKLFLKTVFNLFCEIGFKQGENCILNLFLDCF